MLRKMIKWCLCHVFVLVVVRCGFSEEFSSMSRIKDKITELRQDRSRLELRRLLSKQEKRLGKIKGLVHELQELSGDEIRDPKFTVHHPINAYRFIRNHSVIYNETATKLIKEIRLYEKERDETDRIFSNMPTVEAVNVEETIFSLIKLQSAHGFQTNDIADGIINGKTTDKMTARECQDMMAGAYQLHKSDFAEEWLTVALKRVSAGDSTASKTEILSKAAASTL